MKKVRLYCTLVGRSNAWKRNLTSDTFREFTSDDTFVAVYDTIADQFGDRAIVVPNEISLRSGPSYPEFYSAGWFVSQEETPKEIVMVGHGSTMESATKDMMNLIQNSEWDLLAKEVPLP